MLRLLALHCLYCPPLRRRRYLTPIPLSKLAGPNSTAGGLLVLGYQVLGMPPPRPRDRKVVLYGGRNYHSLVFRIRLAQKGDLPHLPLSRVSAALAHCLAGGHTASSTSDEVCRLGTLSSRRTCRIFHFRWGLPPWRTV
eukprot:gene23887-biopygen1299